ncbi:MAG TPA: hypothetical protein DCX54_11505 [Flavobacteriales bacterium]|nr:hypothetical protein [Flavobacteriales bacterium]
MKKILLAFMTVSFCVSLNAQIKNIDNNTPAKYVVVTDAVVQGNQTSKTINKPRTSEKNHGVSIGSTYYDLQTNSTVQDRLVMNSNGDISATWTASRENSTTFSDRGTGYAYRNPSTGEWTLDPSYPRIETVRCGWSSLMYDGNGGEVVVAHTTETIGNLKLNKRSSIGTGSWTQKDVSPTKLTWCRAAMGGNDGNTLHIIAATDSADWANHQNMYRAIVYYRSQDAGSTFDKVNVILPGIDSAALGASRTDFQSSALDVDAYAIAAKGNTVAFALFNRYSDIILMKSTDNGSNWTKTIVNDFPYKNYRDMDNNCDSTHRHWTSDNSGAILIDASNKVHLAWGQSRIRNNDVQGDGSYIPGFFVDSLGYWNESMGPKNFIHAGNYVDKNQDNQVITMKGYYSGDAFLTMPNMSEGSDGSIYIAYSAVTEDTTWASDGITGMRHIHLVRSKDGGATWGLPKDLTPHDPDLSESVYPDMLPTVDNKIRLIYQHDWHPGNYVSQITPPANIFNFTLQTQAVDGEIVYIEVDTALTIGIEKVISGVSETGVFPNPSNGNVDLTVVVYEEVDVQVYVTNISGQIVYTYQNESLKLGKNKIHMNLNGLNPGLYFVNVNAEGNILTEKLMIK